MIEMRSVPPDPWAPGATPQPSPLPEGEGGERSEPGEGPAQVVGLGQRHGSVSPESLEVSTGFCHLRGGRPAHGAAYVSAETNNLVTRIAVSERAGNRTRLLRSAGTKASVGEVAQRDLLRSRLLNLTCSGNTLLFPR